MEGVREGVRESNGRSELTKVKCSHNGDTLRNLFELELWN
jgi:hypothetical protein